MDDYINFIDILSQEANIMDKAFFVVIPYYVSQDTEKALQETKNFFKAFSKSKGPEVKNIDRSKNFTKEELDLIDKISK